MPGTKGKALKGYEAANVLLLFVCVAGLALLAGWFFVTFRSPNQPPEPEDRPEIVEEIVVPEGDGCAFHLGTVIARHSHAYRSPLDIPPTDDGLVRDLFSLPEITEVLVEPRMIMLRTRTAANWGVIQPMARAIINKHLHLHV